MPRQSHSGIHGIPWSYCDRCGAQFPLNKLRMQNGLLLCKKDYDSPAIFTRDQRVAEFLANAEPEARNETAERRKEPNNQRELR